MLHLAWLHLTCCVVGASEVGAVVGHFELCAYQFASSKIRKWARADKTKERRRRKKNKPFFLSAFSRFQPRTKNKNKKNNLIAFTSNKQATVIADHAF